MRAAILAGGKGTRLRPYTTVLPKPLVPVGEVPILERVILQLAKAGFHRIDLCVGHLGELIRAYFSEGVALPPELTLNYYWEKTPLGTAGALHLLEDVNGPLLVMNGDILTDLDYADLMRFHAAQDAAMTIAAFQKDVFVELGVIEGEGERVADYIEKPTMHFKVSMGIYVYEPRAIEHVPAGHYDFPDLVKTLLAAGESVATYNFDGKWFDIGTPGEHERALTAFEENPELFRP